MPTRSLVALAVGCAALAGCASGGGRPAGDIAAYEAALARHRTPAHPDDVRFFTGMIPHHAQALLFAGWAESHGASEAVRVLCERIVVAQGDEIRIMQTWLADHGQPVPEVDPVTFRTTLNGEPYGMRMMGMLSEAQLAELDAARGREFDRLFLTYMIPHHQGAVHMVDDLFATEGGGVDDFVYKIASDIFADQTTEIERMQSMLDEMAPGGAVPRSLPPLPGRHR